MTTPLLGKIPSNTDENKKHGTSSNNNESNGNNVVVGGGQNTPPPTPSEMNKKKSFAEVLFVDSGSLRSAMISFLLVYNLRFGIALVLRLVTLMRTKPKSLLDLGEILNEKELHFREEAVRMGLFMGSFSGIYVTLQSYLPQAKLLSTQVSSVVSGAIAGYFSIFWMKSDWHRTLALYMATRAAQCVYNFSKMNGYFHFWGSSWQHGDSLLFALSSAQIMYSYVMRPNALPHSYYAFIRKQGPLEEVVLQAVRDNCRDKPVNTGELFEYVKKKGGESALEIVKKHMDTKPFSPEFPRTIPCQAMHPYTRYCTVHTANAFWNVAKQIFGVYFSLALAPAVVLRFAHFLKNPMSTFSKSLLSAVRSTIFLSVFCSSYQAQACVQREFLDLFRLKDHRLWYWIFGFLSSGSILIEQKHRRSELALYAFPRGADALYHILYDRKLIFSLPHGEQLLFAVSLGMITFFYEHQRETMSPMVASVLSRFVPEKEGRKRGDEEETKKELEGKSFSKNDKSFYSLGERKCAKRKEKG